MAMQITNQLASTRMNKDVSPEEIKQLLVEAVSEKLNPIAKPFELDHTDELKVIVMVGVNGSGKTTSIGKLASKFTQQGKTVMLAAGDTFRAAAIEQLKVWGARTDCEVVAREAGADASGIVFDAIRRATKAKSDILIIDTAGRLQNRHELMDELEKIIRIIKKQNPDAPHAVLLTLDATTGQNALSQVEIFKQRAGVTGLIMTKLDGTARGGILVAIADKHDLPIHFIGVGESIDDLEPFEAQDFAKALAGA